MRHDRAGGARVGRSGCPPQPVLPLLAAIASIAGPSAVSVSPAPHRLVSGTRSCCTAGAAVAGGCGRRLVAARRRFRRRGGPADRPRPFPARRCLSALAAAGMPPRRVPVVRRGWRGSRSAAASGPSPPAPRWRWSKRCAGWPAPRCSSLASALAAAAFAAMAAAVRRSLDRARIGDPPRRVRRGDLRHVELVAAAVAGASGRRPARRLTARRRPRLDAPHLRVLNLNADGAVDRAFRAADRCRSRCCRCGSGAGCSRHPRHRPGAGD